MKLSPLSRTRYIESLHGTYGRRVARSSSPRWPIAGRQFPTFVPPGRFFVDGFVRYLAQSAQGPTPELNYVRRKLRAGWFIHKRHKLVREARHGAADADATNVRAAAD